MITAKDFLYVRKHMYSCEHDVTTNAAVQGEPSLVNECVIYQNARTISIVLLPFELSRFDKNGFDPYFEFLKQGVVETIKFIGDLNLIGHLPQTPVCHLTRNEFVLNSESPSTKAMRDFRRGARQGYIVDYYPNKYFFENEIQSIWRSFLKEKQSELWDSDLEFYKSFPKMFKRQNMEIVVVRKNTDLACAGFLHHIAADKKHLLLYRSKEGYRNATDFLLGSIVQKFNDASLFIGPSLSEGMKEFKNKWAIEKPCKIDEIVLRKQNFN